MTKIVAINKVVLALLLLLCPLNRVFAQSLTSQMSPKPTVSPASLPMTATLVSPNTGIDYTPLKNLLAEQKWQQANELTRSLLLKAMNRDLQGWLTAEDIAKLACWDLKTVDDLWTQASNGRFGFSVQYGIFISTGNKPGRLMAPEAYDKFGDQVGWRKNNEWILFKQGLDYSLNAPRGHLPNPRDEYQINGGRLDYTNLTKRLSDCQLVTIPTLPSLSPTTPSPVPKKNK